MTYVNVFGGDLIQPANVSYQKITFAEDDEIISLTWPETYSQGTTVAPAILNAEVDGENCILELPDQTQASPGMMLIVQNSGAKDLIVNPYIGTQVAIIPAGEIFFFWLYDNTDNEAISHWGSVQYGSGTSIAQASDLAGSGLLAQGATLNRNRLTYIKTSAYIVTSADRDKFFVWQGGTGNITLPNASTVGNGFQISINNNSNNDESATSGTINLNPVGGQTIDGYGQFEIFPGESLTVISNGVNWFSLGYSQQLAYAVGVLNLDVTGLGDSINLTTTQAQRTIQNYSGTLAGNTTIYFPATPFNWYISNTTTGAYTLQVQLTGGTGSSFEIPSGERLIFYSDGTSLHSIPTDLASAFPLYAPNGSSSDPSYSFVNDAQAGMYLSTPDETTSELTLCVSGSDVAVFANDAGTTDIEFTSTNTIKLDSSQVQLDGDTFISGNLNVSDKARLNKDVTIGLNEEDYLTVNGLSFFNKPIITIDGTVTSTSIQNSSYSNTGLYFPTTTSVGIATAGTQAASFSSTGIALNQPVTCSSSLTLGTPLAIASGGTGQTTKTAAFNALSPTTTAGDMIARDNVGNDVRVPASTIANEVLLSRVGNIPVWGGYSVLQVQSFTLTTGQTYVAPTSGETDTQLTLSITPTSASSKILVLVSYNGCTDSSVVAVALIRNTLNLTNFSGVIGDFYKNGTVFYPQNISINYLDSPATTSACVYTVVIGPEASGTANVYSNQSSNGIVANSTITLIELGGF